MTWQAIFIDKITDSDTMFASLSPTISFHLPPQRAVCLGDSKTGGLISWVREIMSWIKMDFVTLGQTPEVVRMVNTIYDRYFKWAEDGPHEWHIKPMVRNLVMAGLGKVWQQALARGRRAVEGDWQDVANHYDENDTSCPLDIRRTFSDIRGRAADTSVILTNATPDSIDEWANLEGFAAEMEAVGWMFWDCDTNVLLFPNLAKHNTLRVEAEAAKKKDAARKRVRRTSSGHTPDVRALDKDRDKDRDNSNTPLSPPLGETDFALPENLDTKSFREAWSEWLAYRRERNLPAYKPRGLKALMTRLSRAGPANAAAAIELSISNNWQGLFPDKVSGSGPKATGRKGPRYGSERAEADRALDGIVESIVRIDGGPPKGRGNADAVDGGIREGG